MYVHTSKGRLIFSILLLSQYGTITVTYGTLLVPYPTLCPHGFDKIRMYARSTILVN